MGVMGLPGRAWAALAAALGIAAAAWVVTLRQVAGMDMGAGTRLEPAGAFAATWVVMMAAMMLPGAAPAVARHALASGRARGVPLFIASYLAVWALAGAVVYAVYRPHGAVAAGAILIAAAAYELTPAKRRLRVKCAGTARSGWSYGLNCAGSSLGLMLAMVALGIMSLPWMAVVAAAVAAQRLAPPRAAIDVPVALALAGIGVVAIIAPAAVPGLAGVHVVT